MTYAEEVLAELRRLVESGHHSDPLHEAHILGMWTEGADDVAIVYRHARYPGRFGLRRNVTRWAVAEREDATESAIMLRIDLDEPPPAEPREIDDAGVRWWGDAPPTG
ncbi:hypothetical protein ACFP3Q_13730 [Nocardioides sp. GCM10027113]|uniref:hypothetical protein n=1 Tax=unclassified Nocardioides TaxID=2615069 RepID=UPI003616942F